MSLPDGIPRNLSILVSRLSNNQTQTLKVVPNNATSFMSGAVISFRLPAYKVLDLHSLNIMGRFKLTTTGPNTGVAGMPGFGAGLIQRVTVSANSANIGPGSQHYNEVMAALDRCTVSDERRKELSVLDSYYDYGLTGSAPINVDTANGGGDTEWTVNGLPGTVLGGSHQRFLGTGALGNVQVDIQLASPKVLAYSLPNTAAVTEYFLDKVAMYVRTVDFGGGLYSAMLQKKIQQGGLVIPVKNYVSAQCQSSGGSEDHTIHVGSQCIDKIITQFKNNNYNAVQGKVPDAYGSTNPHTQAGEGSLSTYFRSSSLGDATEFSVVLNNITLPAFSCKAREAYMLMKQAFNGVGPAMYGKRYSNNVKSFNDWKVNKFTLVVPLEHGADPNEIPVLSGLDTLANLYPITVRVMNGSGAHVAIIAVECTSQCVVSPGQVVSFLM
jgi:hypothetical protein